MKTPHTYYRKGKTVWARLRDGREVIGKFLERKGRFIRLENAELKTDEIKAMSFRRHQTVF